MKPIPEVASYNKGYMRYLLPAGDQTWKLDLKVTVVFGNAES